jgi:protein-S-isoprenylcysteine O-methyltransferase Ste14
MADLAAAYRDKSSSTSTKIVFAAFHFAIVAAALWLLFGGGNLILEDLFAFGPAKTDFNRRTVLGFAAVLYFLRTFATAFVFVRRRMPWAEVFSILVLVAAADWLFAFFGGRNSDTFGFIGYLGLALLLIGSAVNTGSEYQRHLWKNRKENAGHLFTAGLFAFSRHPNYFGDLVLFTGWVMVAGLPVLFIFPVLMAGGFVFLNIPAQDRYLEEHYGDEYREYAARVKRFLPFIY